MAPRAKEFDPDEALEKAMELFWRKGYEATSIKNLVDHMGINRFSLYSTFGDKHQLFLAACARYHEHNDRNALAPLETAEEGLPSIREYFTRMVDGFASEGGSRGCLMTNSAVELAPHDQDAAEKTGAFLLRQQEAFYNALGRAQRRGEIPDWKNLNDLARFLTMTAQGLAVLAKISPRREIFDSIVDVSLAALG
jgi:TetR/AcrR family transcriptional repressor of nem operon